MATTIWLVRHGETQANVEGIFQGQTDSPLNDRGRRQAADVARALGTVHFDRIYASDLSRAADTAGAIAGLQGLDVVLDPELRELHYGVLQGVRYDEFRDVLKDHGVADQWGPGIFSANGMAPPGGESIADLRSRIVRFIQRLDETHPPESDQSVLLVAHGGTLLVMLTVLLDLPVSSRQAFVFTNCCVSRVHRAVDSTRLELHNAVYWSSAVGDGSGSLATGVAQPERAS